MREPASSTRTWFDLVHQITLVENAPTIPVDSTMIDCYKLTTVELSPSIVREQSKLRSVLSPEFMI